MVREELERYFARGDRKSVLAAILFGSHAEGRAHRESDVDVAVLLDRSVHPRERFRLRVDLGTDLIAALHRNEVDVVVLNDAPPALAASILHDGLVVFCQDEEALFEARLHASLRAADMQPFLRRMRSVLLEELNR